MSLPRKQIVSAARGDQPMDLAVRNADLVNVFTAEAAHLGILAGTRSPSLSLAGLAIGVIPEVKIGDLGLVHMTSQQSRPLFPAA